MGTTKLDLDQISGLDNLNLEEYLKKMKENNSKVIVFHFPGEITAGVKQVIIRFPFAGVIEQLYASCVSPGNLETIIGVEKCKQENYDLNQNWEEILSTNLSIDSNNRSSINSANQAVILKNEVEVNDHFRIRVLETGGLRDLTVEIKISI